MSLPSISSPRTAAALAVAVLLGLVIGRYLVPAGPTGHAPTATTTPSKAEAEVWTCSMHPQIRQPAAGPCPICGMDLIPQVADADADDGPRALSMSAASRALAEIRTTTVRRAFPEARVRMAGKLEYDETRERSLTARFPARIDELYINYTGIRVDAGQHLATVYSPDLLAAQRELLTAHSFDPESEITRAAREKLRLWDLLPSQIDEILAGDEARDRFVLRAPIGGIVVHKGVQEGDYVTTGQSMFRIVDLSQLWLRLEAYESDLTWLRYGQDVAFTVEAFPGETFHGTIVFIDPEVDRRTRTVPVRVNVPNGEGRLKPGMFARGVVTARVATGGRVYAPELAGRWISPMHPEIVKDHAGSCDVCGMDLVPAEQLGYVGDGNVDVSAPLVVPTSAVLRTGRRAVVYVEVQGAERPTYEGREIVLGPRAGDEFVVLEGLAEGERVVTHGAFKIDSALQIQARPSMMNPDGHTAHAADAHEIPAIEGERLPDLVEPYLALQAALAADDLAEAQAQLRALMQVTGHEGPLAAWIHEMLAAEDLDGIRRPHFERLSAALIAALQAHPEAVGEPLLRMHCPMVYDDRGADWLQRARPLRNPYFGAMMLECGEVLGPVGAGGGGGHAH